MGSKKELYSPVIKTPKSEYVKGEAALFGK
jgi:hypothetical protein